MLEGGLQLRGRPLQNLHVHPRSPLEDYISQIADWRDSRLVY